MEEASVDLSSKLSVTYGANVNHHKSVHHSLFTLLVRIRYTLAGFKTNQSAFFLISVQVYFFPGEIEGERKVFFWRVQEGRPFRKITPKALGCYKR